MSWVALGCVGAAHLPTPCVLQLAQLALISAGRLSVKTLRCWWKKATKVSLTNILISYFVNNLIRIIVIVSFFRFYYMQNRVPSSTRFCRGIKFIFSKETPELTRSEVANIENQINTLQSFRYKGKMINFKLILTMVDGKVCQNLTEAKSSQCCYICFAKPSEMNNLQTVAKKNT